MPRLTLHPVAALFPDLPDRDYAALRDDIRLHGVKVPIVVHGGQVLDGKHRYRACRELGIRCPAVEWNGNHPWLEVQSRNLFRRHLAKEQICAIQKIAAEQFPEIAAPIQAAKVAAKQRKAQAKGERRGQKALSRSQDRQRESADVIGAEIGVSGATVKRVDRLARNAPDLLLKVAAGKLSVKKALKEALTRNVATVGPQPESSFSFSVGQSLRRLRQMIKGAWRRCPAEYRAQLVDGLRRQLQELTDEEAGQQAVGLAQRERQHKVVFGQLAASHRVVQSIDLNIASDMRQRSRA